MAERASPYAPHSRRYQGGCQCGSVLYEATVDLSGTRTHGPSVWEREVAPGSFKLLRGADSLHGYQFTESGNHHFYCARCGTRAYSQLHSPQRGELYTIDLQSLHTASALTRVLDTHAIPLAGHRGQAS
ncbi:MAG TPA: hypothetical protein VI299_03645 [Polyangiales bacterium]